jgi:hypothetical protein
LSDEVHFSPDSVRSLGKAFESELEPIFAAAQKALSGAPKELEPSAFTTFGYAFSMIHVEVIEYFQRDLKQKSETAEHFNDRLNEIAKMQAEAERKSTIHKVN